MTPAFIALKSSTNWSPSGTSRGLNIRSMLNDLFFTKDVNHCDSKRSLPSKQRSRERSALRSLKQQMRSV